jgi:hypothetical protein
VVSKYNGLEPLVDRLLLVMKRGYFNSSDIRNFLTSRYDYQVEKLYGLKLEDKFDFFCFLGNEDVAVKNIREVI